MPLLTRTAATSPSERHPVAVPLLTTSICLLLAVALAATAYRYPPPSLAFCFGFGTALIGTTCLAVARYDAAVALGIGLLGVVFVEPAPSDAIFAVVIAVALVTGRFDLSRVPLVIFAVLGSFISLNLVSAINAIDPGRAATFFSITLYLSVLALWITGYLRSERRARIIFIAYLFAAVSTTVLGVGALLAGFPGSDTLLFNGDRIRGLFKDANVYGPFLIPVALLLLEEAMRPRLLKLSALAKLAILLLLTIGVIFSFSRAAWLNMGVGVLVVIGIVILRGSSGGRLLPVLAMLAVLGVAAGSLVLATGQEKFLTERASLQNYDAERFGAQEAGLELATRYPLGVGPGQFEPQIQYSAHSTYIRSYAEQGPLGLLTVIVLVGSTLLMAIRNATIGRSAYGLGSAALLGAWAGLIANSFFVDTLHWRHFWLVAGLIWVAAMRPTGDSSHSRQPSSSPA